MEISKPDYSDLYKFLTSLGVILLFLALLIPWLFLSYSFDDYISISELSKLPPTAQNIINSRLDRSFWIIYNLDRISIITAVLGFIAFCGGMVPWINRQRVRDDRENLEKEKLDLEVRPMSSEEKTVKSLMEGTSIVFSGDLNRDLKAIKNLTSSEIEQISYNRANQLRITRSIMDCYGEDEVRAEIKIGSVYVDLLVRVNQNQRAVIETVNLDLKNNEYLLIKLERSRETLEMALQTLKSTYRFTQTFGIVFVVLGFEPDNETNLILDRYKNSEFQDIRFRFIPRTIFYLLEKNCSKLKAIIEDTSNDY